MISKLQERSPLKYGLARFASSLSPENMINNRNRSVDFFDKIVDGLYKGAWISSKEADDAKKQYFQFIALANSELKDEFLLYDQKKIRLDHFFRKFMDGNASYKKCWKVVKLVLTLSHGQAAVERGFSVNKEVLVENMQELSLVSQRQVGDYLHHVGKPISEVPMPNDLLKSCKLAHSRYLAALEKQKVEVVQEAKNLKRKLKREEIANVREKKRVLETTIQSMESDIETYSIAAEKEQKFELLSKANAFRDKVKEKKKTLSDLDEALAKLTEEEKNI